MPRGYLKHQKSISRKIARGGSSRRESIQKGRRWANAGVLHEVDYTLPKARRHSSIMHDANLELSDLDPDDHIDHQSDEDGSTRTSKKASKHVGTCAVCLEVKELTPLFRKCTHDAACQQCLRENYIHHSLADVSQYPLTCFFPGCNRVVQTVQLDRLLGLEPHSDAMTKFHRFTVISKNYRRHFDGRQIVHCANCDFPRRVEVEAEARGLPECFQARVFRCASCRQDFGWRWGLPSRILKQDDLEKLRKRLPSQFMAWKELRTIYEIKQQLGKHEETFRVVETLQDDAQGRENCGWVLCPCCRIIICKGDGCNHMTCVCGHSFFWLDAKRTLNEVEQLMHEANNPY